MILRNDGVLIPNYRTSKSAGFDIMSTESVDIFPNCGRVLGTGLFIDSADEDEALYILSRSGLSSNGIIVANAPGLIDADYEHEIKVILWNIGLSIYRVHAGDRIAQGVLSDVKFVENLKRASVTRTGGLGSTGT